MNAVHSLFCILVRDSFLLCWIPSEWLALYTCHTTIVCRIPFISIVRILLISFLCWIHCFFTSCLPLSWFSPILCMSGQLLFTRAFHNRVIWTYYYGLSEPYQYVLSEAIHSGGIHIYIQYTPQPISSGILYIYTVYTPNLTSAQRSLPVSGPKREGAGSSLFVQGFFPLLLIWYLILLSATSERFIVNQEFIIPTVCQVICWVL